MTRHDPDREDRIVSFIEDFTESHGYGPSVREIAAAVGLSSTSATHYHLARLERSERITWSRETARSIRVLRKPQQDGMCDRPGCGKPIPAGTRRTRWCSTSCAVKASQVRAWLRAAGMAYVVTELGLD